MKTDEACIVASALVSHGIDAIEVSGGIVVDTSFIMCRGDIPIDLLTEGMPSEKRAETATFLHSIANRVAMKEAYWYEPARRIKAAIGDTPLMLVGGMRYPQSMENIVNDGTADYVCLSRALVREPSLPNEMAEGRKSPVKCAYCNRCLGKIATAHPLRCYNR
jgi:2,4-dienoyl-CoA reductase-like NADH-dependent reductase (Old Yellow Enzyme family)